MERTKLLTFAVVGLLVLNLLTVSYILVKPGQVALFNHRPANGDGPANVIIERLHFDSEQQQQYSRLVAEHQQQTRQLTEESVRLYRAYYGLLALAQSDSAQANSLTRQIADNQRALAQLNFSHFQQIKALCRPDQQASFTKLVSDLAHLFGRQQRPPRRSGDGPGEGRPDGPPDGMAPPPPRP